MSAGLIERRREVLTGAGRAFSAGTDRSLLDGSASDGDRELAATGFGVMLERTTP
jgi:enoyl-CoA hydratase/carnithine racemase